MNFALYSQHATDVFLLLFDSAGRRADRRHPAREPRQVRLARAASRDPGRPALRLQGPRASTARSGDCASTTPSCCSIRTRRRSPGSSATSTTCCSPTIPSPARASASRTRATTRRIVPKAIVVDDAFDWQGVTPPDLALEQLVIYEVHVKGFTAHPSSGVASPGTYLGFIEKIPHLDRLGVNAVELLPVHEYYVDDFLVAEGPHQLLGLQLDRILRAGVVLRHRPDAGLPGRRVQDAGPGAAPGGHQGHPRRRLQPHRRGQRDGPDPVLPRHRQPVVLQPDRAAPTRRGATT